MLLEISHETTFRYKAPVDYSIQYLRLMPRTDRGQRVLSWRIDTPGRRFAHRDAFGNIVHTLSIVDPHDRIRIVVQGVVETRDETHHPVWDTGSLPALAYLLPTALTTADDAIRALSRVLPANAPTRAALLTLAAEIEARVRYLPGMTDTQSTAIEALGQGAGVCQDHAHLFIACCRAAGVPARYVSGYLHTGENHLASHAWAEAWSDQEGWIEIDITISRSAGPETCRLAIGRDYLDAAPTRGVRSGGGEEALDVLVRVTQGAQQ